MGQLSGELYGKTKVNHRILASDHAASDLMWLYLGGPMMWQQNFNFPAFDEARDQLGAHPEVDVVFSPADNDREQGFDGTGRSGVPDDLVGVKFDRRTALRQDMEWIALHSDGMVVLPGWESSDGTRAEVAFHQGLHLPVWLLEDFLAYGVNAPQLTYLALPDAPPALNVALPPRTDQRAGWCDHRDHAGGHKPYDLENRPGECYCGIPDCSICPAVVERRESINWQGLRSSSLPRVRTFETGADRDTAEHKIDPAGALSPLVIQRYCEYMRAHSIRQDGSRRRSDNWKKGMPVEEYMSSLWRHLLHAWLAHNGNEPQDDDGHLVTIEDALCGVLFNASGYLHEVMRDAESSGSPG